MPFFNLPATKSYYYFSLNRKPLYQAYILMMAGNLTKIA